MWLRVIHKIGIDTRTCLQIFWRAPKTRRRFYDKVSQPVSSRMAVVVGTGSPDLRRDNESKRLSYAANDTPAIRPDPIKVSTSKP
jgi:hypothetical protein